ncbi:hypothetical protein [Sphingobacterium bambusae]|uniref:DUF4178 domain-containing protein n=1 Tax=Sphingobacterium bambusae TaxID=662858 RepID=A0ABW6BJ43_9SPHI|nr:hypothetical protein [Sphingobacterium bambusae]WPL50998.1 hypothetical protein SCB77_11110 [Sphingobacterium bambusae]
MNIICPKCQHKHVFNFTITDYLGFICVNCHSYFKGDNPENWVFVKTFNKPEHVLWATIGEHISYDRSQFTIITKIQRFNKFQEYSNEYVGLTHTKRTVYFSDGSDYACVLKEVPRHELTFTSDNNCRYKKGTYEMTYSDSQHVSYAEGFVFEDLEKESTTLTYIKNNDENKLISREYIEDREECYQGTYWDEKRYYSFFNQYHRYVERKSIVSKRLFVISLCMVLALGASFYILNQPFLKSYEFTFDQKFIGTTPNNEFIGESFALESQELQQLDFIGISESNREGLLLAVKLVDEKTNEVYQTKEIRHLPNDINYAAGITADFCKVPPGNYHFIFSTSSARQVNTTIALEEDYKVIYGGISYFPLLFIYIALIGTILLYRRKFFAMNSSSALLTEQVPTYMDVLKFKKLLAVLILLFAIQYTIHFFVRYAGTCSTSTKVSALEDHTYTGSRMHYYRRTYNDYGTGHK